MKNEAKTHEDIWRIGNEILLLPPDWDSYDGSVVAKQTAVAASAIAHQMLGTLGVPLFITPLNSGGVQVEFHGDGLDVVLSVEPARDAETQS